MNDRDDALLRLELYPHRSLPRTGFLVLMALVSLVSFAIGIAFTLIGAWPVLGFFGLDVLIIYAAFRLNYRAGRLRERVSMTRDDLTLERQRPNGKVERWSFNPYWVRCEAADRHLTLTSHGRQLRFGAFLLPEEREEVAGEIRTALDRARQLPMAH